MSLLPLIFRDIERPMRMLEQQMRLAEEACPYLNKELQHLQFHHKHDSVTQDKEKFQVQMDMKHFAPEEITVKTTNNNTLTIEAKHESKQENGSKFIHYVKQIVLPEGHDMEKVQTKLSGYGVLTVTAPNKVQSAIHDRAIPVTHVVSKN